MAIKTVLIRVTASRIDGDYDVALLVDGGRKGWIDNGVSAVMPASPAPPNDKARAVLGDGPLTTTIPAYLAGNRQSPDFGFVGEVLADCVLTGAVGDEWDDLRKRNRRGLRTLLEFEPDPLRAMPWELMSRGERQLFADPTTLFSRVMAVDDEPDQELLPLRLLVVEGMRDTQIGTDVEVRMIRASLAEFRGRVEAVFLRDPSEQDLSKAFTRLRPHIFHFVGHGVRQPVTNAPALQMAGWLMPRAYILGLVDPVPRLAVLNACRSEGGDAPDEEKTDAVRSLANAFLEQGAAAVIGMQGDVKGQAAARFGGELYRSLARGTLVDEAVANARRTVYAAVGVPKQERDWALPSLTLRVRPAQVLPLRCGKGVGDDERIRIESDLFTKLGVFIDRVEERLDLVSATDPDQEVGQPQRLLRLEGVQQVGKTSLVTWIRTRCALRGRRVRYVDFRGSTSLNFIHALFAICDSAEDVPALGPPPDAFDRFHYDLSFLLHGTLPREPDGNGSAPRPELPAPLELGEGIPEQIVASFRDALAATTTARTPLVLVLDHIRGVLDVDFRQTLFEFLVKPIERGDLPHVRLVVVSTIEQLSDYWPAEALQLGYCVPVDLIKPEDFEACAEEAVLALGKEFGPHHIRLIEAFKPGFNERWKPMELASFQDIAAKV